MQYGRIGSYCIFVFGVLVALLRFFSYDWIATSFIRKGDYMNSITELLNLEDENLIISDISIEGTSKIIT